LTGAGSAAAPEVKPDAAPAAVAAGSGKASGDEPEVEPAPRTKKVVKYIRKHGKKVAVVVTEKVEPKDTPEKVEPKDTPEKVEPRKTEPPEECCTVTISSVPSDAAVLRGGRPIGRTPYKMKLSPGESVNLVLAKGGHADQPITVKARNGVQSFRLRRRLPGGAPDNIPGSDPGGMPGEKPF
jgi:outer membrane biosynthesis protein TonB